MELRFLGGAREVGRSGVFLKSNKGNVIMDYGLKIDTEPPEVPKRITEPLDGVIISHSHLDHCGMVPSLFSGGASYNAYSTSLTFQILRILAEDTLKIAKLEGYPQPYSRKDIERLRRKEVSVPYRKEFNIKDLKIKFFDAGHIPGAAAVHIDTGEKTILYTGDFKVDPTELVNPADLNLPEVDILITESTYSDRDHPNRDEAEKVFANSVKETLDNEGRVFLPAFAIGRSQELLLTLQRYGIKDYPIYLDGMGKKVLDNYLNFSGFIRDSKELHKAASNLRWIHSQRDRQKALRSPGVIISSAGMLEGGPIRYYLDNAYNDPKSKIILSGFQAEDTAGRLLKNENRYLIEDELKNVKATVESFDFSAHAGRSEILKYIEAVNPKQIFTMHGDRCKEFALELQDKGFVAAAPEFGETFKLK